MHVIRIVFDFEENFYRKSFKSCYNKGLERGYKSNGKYQSCITALIFLVGYPTSKPSPVKYFLFQSSANSRADVVVVVI